MQVGDQVQDILTVLMRLLLEMLTLVLDPMMTPDLALLLVLLMVLTRMMLQRYQVVLMTKLAVLPSLCASLHGVFVAPVDAIGDGPSFSPGGDDVVVEPI